MPATMPLCIGSHVLSSPVALAPMSGVSDAPMRRMAMQFGAGWVVSEMVASECLVDGDRDAVLKAEAPGVGLHVVQLAGCEARWMAEGARVAEAAGADVIDINMGCPAKRVTNGYAGSALMRDLDHAMTLVEAVVGAVRVPVTLKMRLGWDDRSINAPELARRAENAGVRLVTVHGRTRCQFYKGQADWRAIRAVVDAVSIPVVANGDLQSVDDARTMLDQSGAAAVMVGRAAVGRPWLPGQLAAFLTHGRRDPDPSLADQFTILQTLYDGWLAHYGTAVAVRHARKHLAAALDVAAACAPPASAGFAARRGKILTAEDHRVVASELRAAYDDLCWRAAA